MNAHEVSASPRSAPEIEALAALASVDDIARRLGEAATAIGRINSVVPIVSAAEGGDETCGFLVNFERTQDAMAASHKWHCYQFGFTSVLVSVKRTRSH